MIEPAQFQNIKVLVLGDLMIDAYVYGHVHRISPEAPVPVLLSENRENRLGGAANVALNLQKLGAQVGLCGLVGKDEQGNILKNLLIEEGLSTQGVIIDHSRKTTIKTRVLENGKHLLRIDEEDLFESDEKTENKIFHVLSDQLRQSDVLILQDYDKGLFSKNLIQQTIKLAKEYGVKIAVDPKLQHFLDFKKVDLFKPNLKELKEGLPYKGNLKNITDIKNAVTKLQEKIEAKKIMVTLSEKGVLVFENDQFFHMPAYPRNIVDVSGAGDAVISVAGLLLALDAKAEEIATLSNLAGGLVCEKVGVAPIGIDQLIYHVKNL